MLFSHFVSVATHIAL